MYHIGLIIKGTTAQIQACKCIDFLSCEIYEYYGQRETTKAELIKKLRYENISFLKVIKKDYPGVKRLLKTLY